MKQLLIAALSVVIFGSVTASPTDLPAPGSPVDFIVACGSSSGTYEDLIKQLQPFLSDSVTFKLISNKTAPIKSTGAIQNLDLLMTNQAQGAFMHSDVIEFRKRSGKDMSKFKTLIALHLEEVHLLVLSNSKRTERDRSSWNPMAKKEIVFNTLDDLAGFRVGAAGGGFITANVMKALTLVPYEIVQYQSGDQVLAALDKGEIDCGLWVGGAPLPNLKDLGPQYKLLSIPDGRITQLEVVYRKTSLTYPNMSPESVNTVAADCLFVTQDYKSPRYRSALKIIRKKFYEVLEELKETPGNHPKWQEVDPKNIGKWPWLELEN